MGAFGGLLGLSGGVNGTGIGGPTAANIVSPTTAAQANAAYTSNQGALSSQAQLLQALQAQGGLNNQSQIFNQLQGVANGTGPNPAQAMLNQATGANVANQAALMAGQRGAGANVGLIARQAAMQGANTQQQAAGQAATMQANQSLNALGQMGNIANTQAANQVGATSANTQAQQSEQANLLNAINNQNTANVSSQGSINAANSGLANTVMQGQKSTIGGLVGGAAGALGLAEGGQVPRLAEGGALGPSSRFGSFLSGWGTAPVTTSAPVQEQPAQSGPTTPDQDLQNGMSKLSGAATKGMQGMFASSAASPVMAAGAGDAIGSLAPLLMVAAKGGKVPALVSPGEKYLPPSAVDKVKRGANPIQVGKTIPGKPKVGGAVNSYANDTVPAELEEGGIVLPRSVTQSKNPGKSAHDFVNKVLAKRRK